MSAAFRRARCRRARPRSSEEGVYIDNFKLVDRGRFRERELYGAARPAAKYPARNPLQNVNDLKAQIAANEKGAQELRKMVAHFTLPVVTPIWAMCRTTRPRACAASSTACTTAPFPTRWTRAPDQGQDHRRQEKREATVDFTGTSPQQPTNFNAPEPVTRAAVLYVFRVMVDDDIPMNAGCLRPIRIVIPEGSMLTPQYPAAVVAGNVETSQAVTDCLFGALGALGAAQGTMNNLNFGNAKYQYYETICSGSPAGPGFDGTERVHTHMTNTRLTDPEVLEFRYPVVLEDFHIRARLGRQRQMERRRRDPAHHTVPRKNGMHNFVRPPPGAAVRPRGRQAGQVGENWARDGGRVWRGVNAIN
jgi:5-oxoprolinase (ATP-hydrolysing)